MGSCFCYYGAFEQSTDSVTEAILWQDGQGTAMATRPWRILKILWLKLQKKTSYQVFNKNISENYELLFLRGEDIQIRQPSWHESRVTLHVPILLCAPTSEQHPPSASFVVQQQWQRGAAPHCCYPSPQSEKSGVPGQRYGNGSPPGTQVTLSSQCQVQLVEMYISLSLCLEGRQPQKET